jgi:hypothetical protein
MDPVAPPLEILEMSDQEMRELVVTGFEVGSTLITPRDRQSPKTVTVVRLHVARESKPLFPYYWDLTAGTLTAQAIPLLSAVTQWPRVAAITKYGVAPRARYGFELRPYVPS